MMMKSIVQSMILLAFLVSTASAESVNKCDVIKAKLIANESEMNELSQADSELQSLKEKLDQAKAHAYWSTAGGVTTGAISVVAGLSGALGIIFRDWARKDGYKMGTNGAPQEAVFKGAILAAVGLTGVYFSSVWIYKSWEEVAEIRTQIAVRQAVLQKTSMRYSRSADLNGCKF